MRYKTLMNQISTSNSPIRSSQRKRQSRSKKQKKESQEWTSSHYKRYYMFYVIFATKYPFYYVSWAGWKPQKIYPKMAVFINSKDGLAIKNQVQCKSLDERLKNLYFEPNKTDILQLSIQKLKQFNEEQSDPEIQNILKAYQIKKSQKSLHMKMCLQKIQMLKKCENTIKSLWEDILSNGIYEPNQKCEKEQKL